MPVGDVLKIRTVCYTPTQIGVNVLFYQVFAETGGTLSGFDIGSALSTVWAPLYKAFMPALARWRGVGVQRILPVPLPEIPFVGDDGPGVAVGDLLPTQTSGLIGFITALASRHGRGRAYPAFPADNWVLPNGDLGVLGRGVLQNLADKLLTPGPLVSGGITMTIKLIVRRFDAGPPPLISFNDVGLAVARPKWATQRRRGQFGRQNPLPF